jgi:hypothetical protein
MFVHHSFIFPHSHQTDSDTFQSVRWDFPSPDGKGKVLLSQPPLDLGLWRCRQMDITQTDSSISQTFFLATQNMKGILDRDLRQVIYNLSFRKRRETGAHILPSLNALNWRSLLDSVNNNNNNNNNNNTTKKSVPYNENQQDALFTFNLFQ